MDRMCAGFTLQIVIRSQVGQEMIAKFNVHLWMNTTVLPN